MIASMNTGKLALIFTTLIWGISFSAVEMALNAGWTPFMLLGIRGLLAGSFLLLFSYQKKFWRNKALMRDGMIAGFFLSFGMILQTFGQQASSVQNASFITVMYVVFVPLILWKKHKLSKSLMFAIVLAVLGTAFLSLDENFSVNVGDLLLLACAYLFAIHIIFMSTLSKYKDPLSATTIQSFTMAIISLSFAGFGGESLPTQAWGYVIYAGVLASGVAMLLQMYGQSLVHPTVSGLLLTLESFFGALTAVLFLGESVTLKLILGGGLLMLAVVMVELGPKLFKPKALPVDNPLSESV